MNESEKLEIDNAKDREIATALYNARAEATLTVGAAVFFGFVGLETINGNVPLGVISMAGSIAFAGWAMHANMRHQEILAGRFLPKS